MRSVPRRAGGLDKESNMQWIEDPDHRFKTLVDVKERRKLRRMVATPARPWRDNDHTMDLTHRLR